MQNSRKNFTNLPLILFWAASKETKRIFFVKWHTLQKMMIIIPKILFPFSIREFPKNDIGYIEWPLVQKVESYWSSLFCENFFIFYYNRKKINPVGFCGQKSYQCTHKFLMIYCMNGKIPSTKYICSAIFTALNLVKIVTYLYICQQFWKTCSIYQFVVNVLYSM